MSSYLHSPFNFTGSKTNLLSQIIPYMPNQDSHEMYDVFAGGLSVTINTGFYTTISNDIIKPLIDFYVNLKDKNYEEICEEINHYIFEKSKDAYVAARSEFNKTKNPYLFFVLCNSCTNNMMRFNKKFEFNQTFGKRSVNTKTWEKLKLYKDYLDDKSIVFTSLDYEEFLDNEVDYDNPERAFVYLDPPYLITEAGYNAYWSKEKEKNLYTWLDKLTDRGVKFMMSNVLEHNGKVNEYIRGIEKYNVIELNKDYEKAARNKGKNTIEVIVTNYTNNN